MQWAYEENIPNTSSGVSTQMTHKSNVNEVFFFICWEIYGLARTDYYSYSLKYACFQSHCGFVQHVKRKLQRQSHLVQIFLNGTLKRLKANSKHQKQTQRSSDQTPWLWSFVAHSHVGWTFIKELVLFLCA